MSTNYYANLALSREVNYEIHIGKRTSGGGISTFSGKHFSNIQDLKSFLRYNQMVITIKDEYGDTYELEDFIRELIDTPSDSTYQLDWVKSHPSEVTFVDNPPAKAVTWNPMYWLDGDNRLFDSGEFS